MMSANRGFFHHFMPKTIPCMIMPSISSPLSPCGSDHILNLSASMSKHCPMDDCKNINKSESNIIIQKVSDSANCLESNMSRDIDCHSCPDQEFKIRGTLVPDKCKKVDMNCNDVKTKSDEDECASSIQSENNVFIDDDQMTDIDVDDNDNHCEDEQLDPDVNTRKTKSLAFGIDRILFSTGNHIIDQKPPTSPNVVAISTPPSLASPVVSNLSSKCAISAEAKLAKDDKQSHHHIMSKLKLFTEPHKRAAGLLPNFPNYSNSPYHLSSAHMSSIIGSNPTPVSVSSSASHHSHHHQHHHPLSHCSECLFLRRYCGGSGPGARVSSASSSSANNVATNNMQFSSSITTPCGPTAPISASFTWMANPSIYDPSSIISPVSGYNPHMPLQPNFGLGHNFSTLATIQQCNSGGSGGRRKRSWSRAVFSNLQRKGLEKRFQLQKYITKPDRRQLAATLGLTDAQVKVWFQNRRMKWRHSKEGKVSSGTGESCNVTPSSSPVTSTTSSKPDGSKDKKL